MSYEENKTEHKEIGKYAAIKYNDVANAPGISVSVYVQGCPHHCPHCFNPGTWDFNAGNIFTSDTMKQIDRGLIANGVKRSLCILGGEPLCQENRILTCCLVTHVRAKFPEIPIYIWTGYLYEDLLAENNIFLKRIFNDANYLIDGPFIEAQKDLSLELRGSANQRVIQLDSFLKK